MDRLATKQESVEKLDKENINLIPKPLRVKGKEEMKKQSIYSGEVWKLHEKNQAPRDSMIVVQHNRPRFPKFAFFFVEHN